MLAQFGLLACAVQLSGMQHGKDRVLGFDPCCVSYYNNGEYLLVSGADKKATLMTKEGVKLSEITTQSGMVLYRGVGVPEINSLHMMCRLDLGSERKAEVKLCCHRV